MAGLRVKVVLTTMLLVIQLLSLLLGVALRLLAINCVEALRLDQLVDFGAGNSGNKLLSEGVAHSLA